MRSALAVGLALGVTGCGLLNVATDGEFQSPFAPQPPDPEARDGIGALGFGNHSVGNVDVRTIATRDDGLRAPRDLDFNPSVPGELWIMNRGDDSAVTVNNVGTDDQVLQKRKDPYAEHFMEETSSISFSTDMKFGTCHESRNTYNGQAEGNDFMGPVLWSADPDIFAKSNPAAVAENGFDLGSHLDMLHESPLCMGIAWEQDNVYYTFDGLDGTISRYDFADDHGAGFDDHSDGVVERFVEADVVRVANVPSHMLFDADAALLYVADTGNARIGVLDPSGATVARSYGGLETTIEELQGASWSTLVNAEDGELEQPSGIALFDDVLYVADNATSRITAFSLDGERLDWLDVDAPAGALMGLRVDDSGAIFVIDNVNESVLRISAQD